MFNIQSFFSLVIILHLLCAGLLWEIYKESKEQSARFWIYGSVAYAAGLILIISRPIMPSFIGFTTAYFLITFSNVLFGYSLMALAEKKIARKYEFEIFLIIYACSFPLLLEAKLFSLIPTLTAGGIIFTSLWVSSVSHSAAKKLNSPYLLAMHYLFIGSAIAWLIRLPLAAFFNFTFITDANIANWGTLMVYMCCTILIQIAYLVVRLSILYQERLTVAEIKQEQTVDQMLSSLNALAMARDNETGNHIIRTQHYVKVLAQRLKSMGHHVEALSDKKIKLLYKAAPLHDVGKVGISDSILLKPGALTEEEWTTMKTHTLIGESVLKSAEIQNDADDDVIATAILIAGGHHEKWDGSGYPRGLRGEKIPLAARIMSLADMYDALVSERVYKDKWTHAMAAQEIVSKKGVQFDPVIVEAFLAEQDEFERIATRYRDH